MPRSIAEALAGAKQRQAPVKKLGRPAIFDLCAHLDAASVVDALASIPRDRGDNEPALNLRQAKHLIQRPLPGKHPKRFAQGGLEPCELAIHRKLPG